MGDADDVHGSSRCANPGRQCSAGARASRTGRRRRSPSRRFERFGSRGRWCHTRVRVLLLGQGREAHRATAASLPSGCDGPMRRCRDPTIPVYAVLRLARLRIFGASVQGGRSASGPSEALSSFKWELTPPQGESLEGLRLETRTAFAAGLVTDFRFGQHFGVRLEPGFVRKEIRLVFEPGTFLEGNGDVRQDLLLRFPSSSPSSSAAAVCAPISSAASGGFPLPCDEHRPGRRGGGYQGQPREPGMERHRRRRTRARLGSHPRLSRGPLLAGSHEPHQGLRRPEGTAKNGASSAWPERPFALATEAPPPTGMEPPGAGLSELSARTMAVEECAASCLGVRARDS